MSERRPGGPGMVESVGPCEDGAAESVLPHLSERLEGVAHEVRESLLVKAFLLLADAHGDARTALACLEEAARSNHGARDDSL